MIKLSKKKELNFNNNDIYILETLNDSIIINDNDQGLIFLNLDLTQTSAVKMEQPVYIYSIFKSFDKQNIMLYCPDEELLINLEMLSKKVSYLNIKKVQGILSQFYYWTNNICIFVTDNSKFYEVDLETKQINEIHSHTISTSYTLFYNFLMKIRNYEFLYQINSSEQNFIYEEKTTHSIIYMDYINNQNVSTHSPSVPYHDIIYQDGYFAFISEKSIEITANQVKTQLLPENSGYIFLKAHFIKEQDQIFLVVLISNKENKQSNKLIIYKIDKII